MAVASSASVAAHVTAVGDGCASAAGSLPVAEMLTSRTLACRAETAVARQPGAGHRIAVGRSVSTKKGAWHL